MTKISKVATLQRTKTMLRREWNLQNEPLSNTDLLAAPPKGLGKSGNQIRALETPIESVDFADVNAQVTGADLEAAKTVGDLRNVIWDGIPAGNHQN